MCSPVMIFRFSLHIKKSIYIPEQPIVVFIYFTYCHVILHLCVGLDLSFFKHFYSYEFITFFATLQK